VGKCAALYEPEQLFPWEISSTPGVAQLNFGLVSRLSVSLLRSSKRILRSPNPYIDMHPLPDFRKNGPQVMHPTTEHPRISTGEPQFSLCAVPFPGTEKPGPLPKPPQILWFTAPEVLPQSGT
jgi:hypothetical protein